jgi:hypothetical protein
MEQHSVKSTCFARYNYYTLSIIAAVTYTIYIYMCVCVCVCVCLYVKYYISQLVQIKIEIKHQSLFWEQLISSK